MKDIKHTVHVWGQNNKTHSFLEIRIYTNKKEMKEEVEEEGKEREEKEVEVIQAVMARRGTVNSRPA